MEEGDNYIDFEAESSKGKIKLSDILSKNRFVVLYFYPKSFTSGCTQELKRFVELYEEFKKYNTEIIGVSADSVETQKRFAEKYNAKFPIVSDVDRKIINSYGVKSPRGSGASRITFIISSDGKILKVFRSLKKASDHADLSLDFIKSIFNL